MQRARILAPLLSLYDSDKSVILLQQDGSARGRSPCEGKGMRALMIMIRLKAFVHVHKTWKDL